MLTAKDREILTLVQKDARITNQQLAEAVGMSASACWRRLRDLEEQGYIKRYSALIDHAKAGFAMSAILHVTLERHDASFVEHFISRIRDRPEVLDCFATTGDADFHLRVITRDMAAYNDFLDHFLFRLPGVRHVRTNMILKDIKSDVSLPFSV